MIYHRVQFSYILMKLATFFLSFLWHELNDSYSSQCSVSKTTGNVVVIIWYRGHCKLRSVFYVKISKEVCEFKQRFFGILGVITNPKNSSEYASKLADLHFQNISSLLLTYKSMMQPF